MADQLLSIEDSTLTAIANAIRNKGGLPQSNKLSFPDGMVAALQNIETEATVTPKITPQQVTLTPSNTSFPIAAGFHDGTGTVKIETETGSANPTSTEQTYYPSAGKFFSSFYVGGIGNGKQVVTGTITVSSSVSLSITGLPTSFTPEGIIGGVCSKSSNTRYQCADFIYAPSISPSYIGKYYGGSSYTLNSSDTWKDAQLNQGSVYLEYKSTSSAKFANTIFYVIWGS